MAVFAERALTPMGWQHAVRIELADGAITSIEAGSSARPGDDLVLFLVPGMANVHSHAFQRAMAGLTEQPGPGRDNFWSWREQMYRFTFRLDPEQMQAVAAQLYVEMLEAGFTRVGEFHYLHHDRDGAHYADIAEMAARIAAASSETGIGLTLLPVFYAHAQFGGQPPVEGQRRFISNLDTFPKLLEGAQRAVAGLATARVGIAPHSLRAATVEEIKELRMLAFDGPIHIHVAEQVKEIEDCIAFCGRRPVEHLLDNSDADQRWCFIHATHMTAAETSAMATRGVAAGLCPVTEANLGDGTFPTDSFIRQSGRFGIGSDSNVLIGVSDELRQLEYAQRLSHRARNVLATNGRSTGRTLFEDAVNGGGACLTHPVGLAAGMPADFVSLRPKFDFGFEGDQVLDSWIFGNGIVVDSVWSAGRQVVTGGRHIARDRIASRYGATMAALLAMD